jgi:hypothetical protein
MRSAAWWHGLDDLVDGKPHMWNGPRCKGFSIDFTRADDAFICTAL